MEKRLNHPCLVNQLQILCETALWFLFFCLDFCLGAIEWSGLAHQVSSLLSNYLSCVLEEGCKDGVSSRDALQYVMELLHGISRSVDYSVNYSISEVTANFSRVLSV